MYIVKINKYIWYQVHHIESFCFWKEELSNSWDKIYIQELENKFLAKKIIKSIPQD
jgi:hypothetical protein